jgi:bifunctional UDP-N-acetylglucosamine pyrophosphorylase/glucosamine-1-phosphate N-acetyltransferase
MVAGCIFSLPAKGSMKNCAAAILAAGKGTRMKSDLCKVLHAVAGRPMIAYVLDAVQAFRPEKVILVVGHQADLVKQSVQVPGIEFVVQEPQLGTGHAVGFAAPLLKGFQGDVLILCGDTPLIQPETLEAFLGFHRERRSRLTVMTTIQQDPRGYGRIVRDDAAAVTRIVEERDADEALRAINEINTGIYVVDSDLLFSLLDRVGSENAQGEYYLTDIVAEAVRERIPVEGFILTDSQQVSGVNTRADLAAVSQIVWDRVRTEMMLSGVTLLDPSTVYVDHGVEVGPDTVIHPGVTIIGATRIGKECVIEPGVIIRDCTIGDRVNILLGSRLTSSEVQDGTSIGPMTHLRPEAQIGKNARIGNFVEVKKSVVGDGTKASHLTYLGDSTIGKNVNIGCGTITCNYDGRKKHRTIIHDKCFIGSDVQFVAPVEIGEGSLIGAGSTITRDVPPRSLAVSRAKQKIYDLRKGQGPKTADEDRED